MSTFLKKAELTLENGGYLTSKDGKPVGNAAFNAAQKHAEYVVTLAKAAEGKNFKTTKSDSISDLMNEVKKQLNSTEVVEFVKAPKKKARPTTEALKKEALSFIDFEKESETTAKINAFLQQFNVINEFETFGLFFNSEISKLNKIYTIKEITSAVTSMIEHLD